MGRKNRKKIITVIIALMIVLLTSTATTTVAAGNWGNLVVGDEITWRHWPYEDPPLDPDTGLYYAIKIIAISDPDITYEYSRGEILAGTITIDDTGNFTNDWALMVGGFYGGLSQNALNAARAAAAADTSVEFREEDYTWEGITCETYYMRTDYSGVVYEWWVDQDTGIILNVQRTTGGTTIITHELLSTTANLTRAGICLGTIFIALISVTTLATYSLVRFQKKKKP
jgi:hypothetical protein